MTLTDVINVLSETVLTVYILGILIVATNFIIMYMEDEEVEDLTLWEKGYFILCLIVELLLWPVWFVNSYFEGKKEDK